MTTGLSAAGLTLPSGRLGARAPQHIDRWSVLTTALAAALVGLGLGLGWRGVDLPAQLYRVAVARAHGITLWDSQWYGGHWTLNYSVLFPVTAAFVGVGVLSVLCAAASALAFDRLVVGQLGRYARLGSAVFAVSVIVETSIGQLTFFFGEALALWCLVAATRRHWWLASAAAAASSLVSPLAGAFAGLALFVWWLSLSDWSAPRMSLRGAPLRVLGVAVAGFLPIAATSVLFPGQGTMPYPLTDWVWEMGVALILWTITPYAQRVLRVGIVVYAIAATLCVLIPSPVGGNIGRLEDCLALPLAAVACWDRDPAGRPFNRFGRLAQRLLQPRAALAVVAIPLALSQWAPAWPAITTDPGRPSTHKAYYTPLLRWLDHAPGPLARVEVVPTADHWEAAYVAPTIPLARGWERQLDIADNPIFYTPGALNAQTYLSWLRDNGVRYVAPRVPHAAIQHVPTFDFAVSCSIAPGWSLGHSVVTGTRLWSMPPDYHNENYMSQAQHLPEMRGGAFVQAWATGSGRGRVAAWADSTIFSNFCIYQPGKVEVMLDLVQWLNHEGRPINPAWFVLGLGLLVLAAGLWLSRDCPDFRQPDTNGENRSTVVGETGTVPLGATRATTALVLVAAAVACGWAGGSAAVAQTQHWCEPLPPAVRPKPCVVIDRTTSCVPLADGAFLQDQEGKGYALLEQWIPRLGYVTAERQGAAAFSGDALVVLCPTVAPGRQFCDRLARYVADGGKLLVIDSAENSAHSTANELLRPFGLAFSYNEGCRGRLTLEKGVGNLLCKAPGGLSQQKVPDPFFQVDHACQVQGGQAIATVGKKQIVAAVAIHGKGRVMAVGLGHVWNDAHMGMQWWHYPDATEKARYEALFTLLQAVVEGTEREGRR